MARSRGNAALLAQENLDLTPEETKTMEENRPTEIEAKQQEQQEPASGGSEQHTPTPTPAPTTPEQAPAAAATTTEQQPAADQKRMVELGALHEERERRKQEASRAQKAEQELARLSGRFTTLEELARAAAAEQRPQPRSPDVAVDPVGHFQAE